MPSLALGKFFVRDIKEDDIAGHVGPSCFGFLANSRTLGQKTRLLFGPTFNAALSLTNSNQSLIDFLHPYHIFSVIMIVKLSGLGPN